jgi:protein gp37
MGKTKIEWCDFSFNAWRGCVKIAAGCTNCYADRQARRNPNLLGVWGKDGSRVIADGAMWREPVKWNKAAACDCHARLDLGERHLPSCPQSSRPRVFCASMADVFEEYDLPVLDHLGRQVFVNADGFMSSEPSGRQAMLDDVRRRLFKLIDDTPNIDWLLLTKRPENIQKMWLPWNISPELYGKTVLALRDEVRDDLTHEWNFRKNVWLGTSVCTQEDADKNIPELLKCRELSPVLFLSMEPLLGPIDLSKFLHLGRCKSRGGGNDIVGPLRCGREDGHEGLHNALVESRLPWSGMLPPLDWVIAGGESGPLARPMKPDWARSIRDQCQAAGVPFLFKQWGEWVSEFHESDPCNRGYAKSDCFVDPVHDSAGKLVDYRGEYMFRIGKKAAGRKLDGREWTMFPVVR